MFKTQQLPLSQTWTFASSSHLTSPPFPLSFLIHCTCSHVLSDYPCLFAEFKYVKITILQDPLVCFLFPEWSMPSYCPHCPRVPALISPHLKDRPCHYNVNNPWLREHHPLYSALRVLCGSCHDLIDSRYIFLGIVCLSTLDHKQTLGKQRLVHCCVPCSYVSSWKIAVLNQSVVSLMNK